MKQRLGVIVGVIAAFLVGTFAMYGTASAAGDASSSATKTKQQKKLESNVKSAKKKANKTCKKVKKAKGKKAKKTTLAKGSGIQLEPGETQTVSLKLTGKGKKAVKSSKKIKADVIINGEKSGKVTIKGKAKKKK